MNSPSRFLHILWYCLTFFRRTNSKTVTSTVVSLSLYTEYININPLVWAAQRASDCFWCTADAVAWSCHVNVKVRPGVRSRCEKVIIGSSDNNLGEKALFLHRPCRDKDKSSPSQCIKRHCDCILTITAHWQPRIAKLHLLLFLKSILDAAPTW